MFWKWSNQNEDISRGNKYFPHLTSIQPDQISPLEVRHWPCLHWAKLKQSTLYDVMCIYSTCHRGHKQATNLTIVINNRLCLSHGQCYLNDPVLEVVETVFFFSVFLNLPSLLLILSCPNFFGMHSRHQIPNKTIFPSIHYPNRLSSQRSAEVLEALPAGFGQ